MLQIKYIIIVAAQARKLPEIPLVSGGMANSVSSSPAVDATAA
jgi:hypothetical protein